MLYEESLKNTRNILTTKEYLAIKLQTLKAVEVKGNQRATHKALNSTSVQIKFQTCKHCDVYYNEIRLGKLRDTGNYFLYPKKQEQIYEDS